MDAAPPEGGEITRLLDALTRGEPGDRDELLRLVAAELHRRAEWQMARERPDHTLQPTALVHDAFLKLVGPGQPREWSGRAHFFAAAARAMRQILINHARDRERLRRGGERRREPLDPGDPTLTARPLVDLIDLNEAIETLGQAKPRAAEVVRLVFYGGLTQVETADQLGISRQTVANDWDFARAWLFRQFRGAAS